MNNSTCPEGKLEPTYWDRPDQYEYFKDLNILLSSTAPRSTSSASPFGSTSSGSSNRSTVIGGAVGGTLGFLAIVALVVFLLWRRKRANRKHDPSESSMEENKPEAGELASPISAGTGTFPPPTQAKPLLKSHGSSHLLLGRQRQLAHPTALGTQPPRSIRRRLKRLPPQSLHRTALQILAGTHCGTSWRAGGEGTRHSRQYAAAESDGVWERHGEDKQFGYCA